MKMVRKWERKKLKVTKLKAYQIYLQPHQSVRSFNHSTQKSMNKHQVDALVIHEATIGEDIDYYNDENDVQNMLPIE